MEEEAKEEVGKRDPNAPKRKYELKNITREERLQICRKGAIARRTAIDRLNEANGIRKSQKAQVVKVSGETKHEIEKLAVELMLSYGEVVQLGIENLKEALAK